MPNDLRGGVISAATENDLSDLDGDEQRRRRALEVFFANRPGAAAEADAEAGYPVLRSLHTARAVREVRQLRSQWNGFDVAFEKAGLRAALERQYGEREADELKRLMLVEEFTARPFLRQ